MSSSKTPLMLPSKAAKALLYGAGVMLAGPALAGTDAASLTATWPNSFQSRLAVWALIETLNADLLASHSATLTLTDWCASHHLSEAPKIVARLQPGAVKPITAEQRRDLAIGPDEPVIYRRVDLTCGTHVLSQADNWYVPSRLTPAMNAALTSSNTPFGLVIRPLHPQRHTLGVTFFWHPLPQDWEMHAPPPDAANAGALDVPDFLFQHRAIVSDAEDRPVSEVVETYTRANLDFVHDK
jgi:hypothetical protein